MIVDFKGQPFLPKNAEHAGLRRRGSMSYRFRDFFFMDEKSHSPGEPKRIGNVDGDTASVRESVWHLFYRFIWPFQYFRDVSRGDRHQQQMSYQHNRVMRPFLPGFMLKWSAVSAHWFAWGSFLDSTLSVALLVAGCFVAATLALIVVLMLGIDWLWLGRFPERF